MLIAENLPILSFTYPPKIERLVCCDFDETYLPFSEKNKPKSGISQLEKLVENHNHSLGLILGWVTGSSIDAVLRKSTKYITRLPHFIASSLGTELYWVKENKLYESDKWVERINHTGFKKENLLKIIAALEAKGISLIGQNDDYQGKYMECHYYRITKSVNNDLAIIKNTATQFNCKALLSLCNPAVGDPANCYDVQLVPVCCGKAEALQFLLEQLNITRENAWAFGDSFNDFEMLHTAGNAFLVGNADPKAKKVFPTILQNSYCTGIAEKLSELL